MLSHSSDSFKQCLLIFHLSPLLDLLSCPSSPLPITLALRKKTRDCFSFFHPLPTPNLTPVEQQTTSYLCGMQKKCFPFDIKESSHQLSKHWPHRRAGMLLQSTGEQSFFQSCVKRNLRLWPQLQERDENIMHVSECQLRLHARIAMVSEDMMEQQDPLYK